MKTSMKRLAVIAVTTLVASACSSATESLDADPTLSTEAPSTTAAAVETTVPQREPIVVAPEYDVFLAAVAETVEGTVFEDVPFDNPELTVATGLLLCERLAGGADVDEVVVDYLAELTEGDVAQADDDQLTLTGALTGAATEALCPELMDDE